MKFEDEEKIPCPGRLFFLVNNMVTKTRSLEETLGGRPRLSRFSSEGGYWRALNGGTTASICIHDAGKTYRTKRFQSNQDVPTDTGKTSKQAFRAPELVKQAPPQSIG